MPRSRAVKAHGAMAAAGGADLGGECTVTVRGKGRGGRCSEFLLSLALELDGMRDIHALACDTDGIDGSEDNAGAVLAPDSLARHKPASAKKLLANNDGYSYFSALGVSSSQGRRAPTSTTTASSLPRRSR